MATLTESLPSHLDIQHNNQDPLQEQPQDKISAYYSLVFPNFTYYIQTLNVIIGRRCVPNAAASSSDNPQVDVDLGSLKSVSRLHAKIEYEEDEERFVLHVMGRNGAWVDGVWSGSGSKVPLGDRSQIQIASRTFHFILPPPPAPEDSPSPSSHSSSGNRPRSPSVDITSLSPPSSIPSCSPPPATIAPALPKVPPEPTLPNSNSISRPKPNPKKRKKSDVDSRPLPKPDVIPPKPQLTYAQLCYRAIKGLHGKASLQEICQWIQETHQYYKYCEKDWESSVRHNLSSNRAFKKAERGPDERGKGALWTVDPQHEHTFEEQEAKRQNLAAFGTTGGKDGKALSKKGKGAPLPPPLTSAPLIPKAKAALNSSTITNLSSSSTPTPIKRESNTLHAPLFTSRPSGAPTPTLGAASHTASVSGSASASTSTPTPASALTTSTPAPAPSAFPAIPASVRIPIIVGPTPGSSSSPSDSATPPKPIVLHENTLVLNPEIFSHLTPQHLKDLEVLGAQKALEILQSYIVRFYKEKLKAENGRGRGRGNKVRRGRGGPPGANGLSVSARQGASGTGRGDGGPTALFTSEPLPPRPSVTPSSRPGAEQQPPSQTVSSSSAHPSAGAAGVAPMASLQTSTPMFEDSNEEVNVVDDDPVEEEPASKKRRVDTSLSQV